MSVNHITDQSPDILRTETNESSSSPADNNNAIPQPKAQSGPHHDSSSTPLGESLLQTFANSNPPLGMWQATAEIGSKIPTLPEIRSGAFSVDGWSYEGQLEGRTAEPQQFHQQLVQTATTDTSPVVRTSLPRDSEITSEQVSRSLQEQKGSSSSIQDSAETRKTYSRIYHDKMSSIPAVHSSSTTSLDKVIGPDATGTYPNGYRFPKKHTWIQSILIGLTAFGKFFITPFGFLITVYGLNVVAWGAMIFFLLLNAAPAMCSPDCYSDYSARKIWIEIDSQVLNALFCVTGFGLIPWRFRDFYYLMGWRVRGIQMYHRRLAGIYRGWYRLPGSQKLAQDVTPPPRDREKNSESLHIFTDEEAVTLESNPAVPVPPSSMPDPPLTGIRAAPSKSWTLDLVIWMYLLNTVFQSCLAGCMWGLNRFTRPSWTTALFIVLGCGTGICAGIVIFIESKRVRRVEGVPVKEYDVEESVENYQARKAKEDAKAAKKIKSRKAQPGEVKRQNWLGFH